MDYELYCIGVLIVYFIFLLVSYDMKISWYNNGWFLIFMGLIGISIMTTEHMILKNKDMVEERLVRVERP